MSNSTVLHRSSRKSPIYIYEQKYWYNRAQELMREETASNE